MTIGRRSIGIAMLALIIGAMTPPRAARAIDLTRRRAHRDLTPALRSSLTDTLSDKASEYLNSEDEKKANHQPYVDLQQQFQYLPNYGPHGELVVSAKLGGAEYVLPKGQYTGKGTATGKLKYLVFTYSLEGGKWVELYKPRWEVQDLGSAAAKKMTQAAERAERYKAARERQSQKTRSTPTPAGKLN